MLIILIIFEFQSIGTTTNVCFFQFILKAIHNIEPEFQEFVGFNLWPHLIYSGHGLEILPYNHHCNGTHVDILVTPHILAHTEY